MHEFFSVLRLFLAISARYLTCLDRMVLAHTFWALTKILQSAFLFLAVGKMELTWVRNGTLGFKKKLQPIKNPTRGVMLIFVPRRLEGTNIKFGNTVTVYHRELLKKRPSLGTFCIHLLTQGLMRSFLKKCPHSLLKLADSKLGVGRYVKTQLSLYLYTASLKRPCSRYGRTNATDTLAIPQVFH